MAKTVVYRLINGNSWQSRKSEIRLAAVLDIFTNGGSEPRRMVVCETQTLTLNYGDRIKCISGKIGVLINPGTPAGAFVLLPDLPSCVSWNERTELEMNDETTKHIHRGEIRVMEDIGTIQTSTGATTR
jgi:hypothetical protein